MNIKRQRTLVEFFTVSQAWGLNNWTPGLRGQQPGEKVSTEKLTQQSENLEEKQITGTDIR